MKIICAIIILVVQTVTADPFFGNNYVVPPSTGMTQSANSIVSSLNSAQLSVNPYLRTLPTSTPYLNEGASALSQYVGNVSRLIGNVYRQLSVAINDKTTDPKLLFHNLNIVFNQTKPFLNNSTLLIAQFKQNFDGEGVYHAMKNTKNTARFFETWNKNMNTTILDLEKIIKVINGIVLDVHGQDLITGIFLSDFVAANTINRLEASLSRFRRSASEFQSSVANLVSAITNANNFRTNFNARLSSSNATIISIMNSYFLTSNTTRRLYTNAVNGIVTQVRTLNDTFMYRWPLLLPNKTRHTFNTINGTLEHIKMNLDTREEHTYWQQDSIRQYIADNNVGLLILGYEADQITFHLLDIIEPNICVQEYHPNFQQKPTFALNHVRKSFTDQNALEKNAIDSIVFTATTVVRSYAALMYGNTNICYSFPFERMNDCLEGINQFDTFSNTLWMMDSLYGYYDQLHFEVANSMDILELYIQKTNLDAVCFGIDENIYKTLL